MINSLTRLFSSIVFLSSVLILVTYLKGQAVTQVTAIEPCTSPTPVPSPSPSSHPSPSPSPTPELLFLTEFMACPSTGNEWIELFNASDRVVTITNWQVVDASNNKKVISGEVLPQTYSIFEWSGSLLNNAGDSFKLMTAEGEVLTSASYENCTSGISFVYENGEWVGALSTPNDETTISQNTVSTASATASLRINSASGSSPLLASATDTGSTNSLGQDLSFPFQLPSSLTVQAQTNPQKEFRTSAPNETKNSGSVPALSVIIGGLLQIIPSGWYLYGSYFNKHG